MISGIFQASTIPLLQEVASFAEARHTVLAGNIANLDTPGYQVRDLSVEDFQERLKTAIGRSRRPPEWHSPGELGDMQEDNVAAIARNPKTILYHDKSNVGIEHQVTEMVKNQLQHNLALALMNSQLRLLQTAIGGKV
jgi:flagellar basal-body rod protein FlgB